MLIDWPALVARYAIRPGALERVLALALEAHLDIPRQLREWAAARNLAEIGLCAHSVQGGAHAIMAADLAAQAEQLVAAVRRADAGACDGAHALARAIEGVSQEIQAHLAQRQAGA